MSVVFANNAATTLAAAITSTSATTITVTSSSSFPSISGSEYFYATIDDGTNKEIVKVTGVSSETWTVVRAQDGTSARTFANSIDVELRNNAAMLSDIKSHFSLADNEILKIGAGNDLQLYHDGTDSIIKNTNGHLYISTSSDDKDIIFQCDDGSGGLATYITVDGSITTTVFNKNIKLGDSIEALFGSSSDFQIQHNGTDTHLSNTTGDLFITNNNDDKDIVLRCDDGSGGVAEYVRLDGSAAKTLFSKDARFSDSVKALFGGSDDLKIYHDATDSLLQNETGDLRIVNNANDKDILIQTDDGSGGNTTYMAFDGSTTEVTLHKNLSADDNVKAIFGAGDDLQIYHDASNSYIDDAGTGSLLIRGSEVVLGNDAKKGVRVIADGAVELRHNDSKKIETTSSGVSVTGGLTTSGASTIDELTVSNDATLSGGLTVSGDASFGVVETDDNIRISEDKFIYSYKSGTSGQVKAGIFFDGTNQSIDFYTAQNERIMINSSGQLGIGTTSPTAKVTVSGNAVGTLITDNDGSFDMTAGNNFKCTPSGNFTLTFTNIISQSGNILLVNSGGHTVSAHTNSKVDANLLATVSTAGTYLISYFSDGTNVYLTNSAAYT